MNMQTSTRSPLATLWACFNYLTWSIWRHCVEPVTYVHRKQNHEPHSLARSPYFLTLTQRHRSQNNSQVRFHKTSGLCGSRIKISWAVQWLSGPVSTWGVHGGMHGGDIWGDNPVQIHLTPVEHQVDSKPTQLSANPEKVCIDANVFHFTSYLIVCSFLLLSKHDINIVTEHHCEHVKEFNLRPNWMFCVATWQFYREWIPVWRVKQIKLPQYTGNVIPEAMTENIA